MNKRGALIALEGCDRAGKSTQCDLLLSALSERGVKVKLVKFPNRETQVGQCIDRYLRQQQDMDDHAIHLLFSANRWEAVSQMERDLSEGWTLILDRYAYSGVVFSASKGLDYNWCVACDKGLLKPDRVLFLDLSIEVAKQRGGFGDERYETEQMQERVRQLFRRMGNYSDWSVLDASQSIQTVHSQMLDIVLSEIKQAASTTELSHSLFMDEHA